MKNIDNYNSGIFIAKDKELDENILGGPEAWLNEHGYPNYEYLKSLAKDKAPEALEQLILIAEDLDVDYSSETSPEELIEKIRLEVSKHEADENENIIR